MRLQDTLLWAAAVICLNSAFVLNGVSAIDQPCPIPATSWAQTPAGICHDSWPLPYSVCAWGITGGMSLHVTGVRMFQNMKSEFGRSYGIGTPDSKKAVLSRGFNVLPLLLGMPTGRTYSSSASIRFRRLSAEHPTKCFVV